MYKTIKKAQEKTEFKKLATRHSILHLPDFNSSSEADIRNFLKPFAV